MAEFPTDEVTLTMLVEACRINPDTGQTHLQDFLAMGERIKSEEQIGEAPAFGEMVPVYLTEYEDGYEPFSEHEVITALAEELLRTRSTLSTQPNSEGGDS